LLYSDFILFYFLPPIPPRYPRTQLLRHTIADLPLATPEELRRGFVHRFVSILLQLLVLLLLLLLPLLPLLLLLCVC
jgi:hypothetical protein